MRMPMTKFNGLLPLLDRRRLQEPFCIAGNNFYVDVDGPVSGFGKRQILFAHVTDPTYIQDLHSKDACFIVTRTAIMQWDNVNHELVPIFTFTSLSEPWPWSHAYVGGYHYFIRKGVNLLQYNASTGVWAELTGGFYPVNGQALGVSDGRLVVACAGDPGEAGVVQYSAIDDGTDFTPDINTGAGAQSLAILGSGEPYAVLAVADGFITATASGLMKSTALNTVNPFHHRVLSTIHKAINPYCLVQVGQEDYVLLTKQGLFRTKGTLPEEWQNVMSEYLHDEVLPNLVLSQNTLIRLFYSPDKRWFIVSIATDEIPYLYNRAFVLYEPSNQFGSYNQNHCAFLNLKPLDDNSIGYDFGVCDTDGNLFVFEKRAYDQVVPEMQFDYFDVHGIPEYPVTTSGTALVFPSVTRGTTWDESEVTDPGIYRVLDDDGNAAVGQIGLDDAALDAYVDIGMIRGSKDQDIDELTLVTKVNIGMLGTAVGDTAEDFMLDYPTDVTIDYLLDGDDEDYGGIGSVFTTDADVYLRSMIDGYEIWRDQHTLLTPVVQNGRFTQYAAYGLGLYHALRLAATAPGKSFHLKTAEFNGVLAGRLQ